MLGWDVTDYGAGNFCQDGVLARNDSKRKFQQTGDATRKPYAEKLLYIEEGQYSPMHFHWNKMEDIINRGGGTVLITSL